MHSLARSQGQNREHTHKLTPLSIHSASAAAFASSFCIFMNDGRRLLSFVVAAVMREANFKRARVVEWMERRRCALTRLIYEHKICTKSNACMRQRRS